MTDFSGKVYCGICGKRCRRKQRNGKPIWVCNDYNMYGKSLCPAKAVPEEILSEFASEINTEIIEKVDVCSDNILQFCLSDNSIITKQWQDRSRRESWTDEMKAKARETYYAGRNQNTSDKE